tara:strand:+ start:863 stop:1195 length:333 start_codon:yes stop_codon:yes gene_type:complete
MAYPPDPEDIQSRPGFEKTRKQAIANLKKQFHNKPGIPGFMSEKAMEKYSDFRLLKGDSADLKKFKAKVRREMKGIDPSLFAHKNSKGSSQDPKAKAKAVLKGMAAERKK